MGAWQRSSKVLALTSIGVYLVSLDVTVVNVGFRSFIEDFGADQANLLTWVLSGYNIAFAAGLLTAGRLADTYGRKRIFLLGMAVFAVGSALCGIAPSAGFLVAARVVQALGGALILPASVALLLPEFPVEKRSVAIGINGAVGGIAAASGPAIGGLVVEHLGWHWLFFLNLPLCALAIWIGRRLLVETRAESAQRPDVNGAALAMGSVALLTLAIIQGEQWGWSSGRTLGTLAVAVALGVVFVARCRVQADPVLDLALFRLRFFTAANVAALLFSMGFFAMFFTNIQWLQGVWEYSVISSGMAMVPGPLMAAVFAAPAGRWAQQHGHAKVVVPGTLLLGGGVAVMNLLIEPEASYWTLYFPVMIVTGIGVGLSISTLGSANSAYLPQHRFAMGSAVNSTARQVGAGLGIAIVTAIDAAAPDDDPLAGFHRSWWFISATVVLAGVAMAALFRRPTEAQLAASAITPAGRPAGASDRPVTGQPSRSRP
jgi:EmrB/QacA subfamily drug resistance transporter